MKLKTSLLLSLACASVSPVILCAASKTTNAKKAAKTQVEYCLVEAYSAGSARGGGIAIYSPNGSTANAPEKESSAQVLSQLARQGWKVVACVTRDSRLIWTLERRR